MLHLVLFPLKAHGHTIPALEVAKMLSSRGIRISIVTTPLNAQSISEAIQRTTTKDLGYQIGVRTIKFPYLQVGLPEGCEHLDFMFSNSDHTQNLSALSEMVDKFFQALLLMQEPFETLLEELCPDALVADLFFPWATDSAAKLGIPRLVFVVTSFFSSCILQHIRLYNPQVILPSDSDAFPVPNIPGEIKLTRKLIQEHGDDTFCDKVFRGAVETELKSYGVIFNSFYELEPAYVDHYRNSLAKRVYHIGPVSLFNEPQDKSMSLKEASISASDSECLKWLNSKKPNSVLYISFGTISCRSASQLKNIAIGLESSGQQFIWVVKKKQGDEDWLPEGFEERMEGKGLLIRGWAPQRLILDHQAVGGFLTHCGWNAILEAINAGLPMATLPQLTDQILSEILVTQVLKIGVGIGVGAAEKEDGEISSEAIKEAVIQIMEGEEAEEMSRKARELKKMARRAVEEGGSSHSDLTALIEGLKLQRMLKNKQDEPKKLDD